MQLMHPRLALLSRTCLVLALHCEFAGSINSPGIVSLRVAAEVSTAGASGFAFFEIDGDAFLLSANFWDGTSGEMSADNVLFSVSERGGVELELRETQRLPGRGGHGADAFATPQGQHYVTIPFYYGCGGGETRGRVAHDAPCRATGVYKWDRRKKILIETQRLATAGPASTGHLITRDGAVYIFVGENFADEVSFWRLVRSSAGAERFERAGQVACPGAGAMAVWEGSGSGSGSGYSLFLAAASYHDNGWTVRSRLFRADASTASSSLAFEAAGDLPGFGAHGVEVLQGAGAGAGTWAGAGAVAGTAFLFISHDRGPNGPSVNSTGFYISGGSGSGSGSGEAQISHAASLPTDGAHGAALFYGPDGAAYAFVANFGDRLGGRVASHSHLWRRDTGNKQLWIREASVESFGATDATHFIWRGRHFVALANEGDIGKRMHQRSFVYEVVLDTANGRDL